MAGRTPRVARRLGEAFTPATCSGRIPSLSVYGHDRNAAADASVGTSCVTSRYVGAESGSLLSVPCTSEPINQIMTRWPGSRYGNGRRSTPDTMAKTAAAAPMPNVSVSVEAAVNAGRRQSERTATLRSRPIPCSQSRRACSRARIARSSRHSASMAATSPNDAAAARRASAGGMPRSMNSRVRISR